MSDSQFWVVPFTTKFPPPARPSLNKSFPRREIARKFSIDIMRGWGGGVWNLVLGNESLT